MGAVKKSKPPKDANLESEIASFASTLGFSTAAPSSGFNDSDFRKTGPLKAKPQPPPKPAKNAAPTKPATKNRKTVPLRNNKAFQNQKRESGNSNLVEQHDYSKFKNLPKLPLVKSSALAVWYNDAAELEEKLIGKEKKIECKDMDEWKRLVEKKKELGEQLLWQYAQEYASSRGKHGDIKMLYTTQRSGTAADKVSALSVLIGDNAVANLRSIDSLLGMVTSKVGKRHAFAAFDALKEMFLILLPDRKLKTLFQRPLNHLSDTKDGYSLLLFWYWEECLKERYEQFVSALQEASLDVIAKLKSLALKAMFTLLKSKSEQERRLLASLVNKLGDPENKIASNADYHLANLLAEHPNMKAVVIDEVDNFLFRPHLGLRSKYHAVNFLTQIRLSHKADGPKAAKRLIDIYFALFKVLISEAGAAPSAAKTNKEASKSSKEGKTKATSESHVEMDSRLLSALLTGVNRAFPYVASDEADSVVEAQTPLLFQLVHSKNFNVGVQALMLLDKISSKNQIVSDRFYRALYSKLLLPAAMNSSKEEMFFALLLRAMKNDINIKRVAAFSKRLLQVALQLPPQYACGCLFLLSEVLKARAPLWNMVLQNEAADADDELEHFEDITENDDATILAKDERDNKNQVADTNNRFDDDSDVAPDESGSEASGSDEEDNLNEPDDLRGEGGLDKLMAMKSTNKPKQLKSTTDPEAHNPQSVTYPGGYNPRHREPSYCNADRVGWWELTALATHVHPSVAAMAETLLAGVNIVYNGNPITDLSLVAFLDKFMEKKAKQSTWHGASQIEPAKKMDMNHQLIGAEILSLAEADVPPEDVVFHKFYMNKLSSSKKTKPKKKNKKAEEDEAAEELYAPDGVEVESDDEEMDNVVDESDNDEIDNVLDSAEADGDYDYDYDNLDKVADEEDEDLIGEASDDEEIDVPSDDEEIDDDDDDDDDDDVAIGEVDDGSDAEEGFEQVMKTTKKRKTSGASPFASLEEYEHLIEDEDPASEGSPEKENKKKRRKKKNVS